MKNTHTSSLVNLYTGENYVVTLRKSFQDIINLLKDHCGPYATNAILPTQSNGTAIIDQYTKDGINIVNCLKTETPLTKHAMRLVSYVGDRVDNACHDGTTTAMLLFCELASRFLSVDKNSSLVATSDDDEEKSEDATYRRYHLRKALDKVIDECKQLIESSKLTIDDIAKMFHVSPDKALWAVAYHQALIAAKGDKELARGVAEVLSSMPVDLYGQYILRSSGIERDERFYVEQRDYDFEIPGILVNTADYNHALRSQLLVEDAILLITPNELIKGNPEAEFLIQFLNYENIADIIDRPFVIIAPSINDPHLYDLVVKHNVKYPKSRIILMHMQVQTTNQSYADALCATAGVLPLSTVMYEDADPTTSFVRGVGVSQRGNRIYIKNLYKKTGDRLHPSYSDPTRNLFYTQVVSELRKFIEDATKRHDPSHGSEQVLMHRINLYRFMASQKLADLFIGGSSHENLANISVAKDAFGAAISAIEDGVVLGGHQRLLSYMLLGLRALNKHSKQECELNVPEYMERTTKNIFARSLLDVLYIIYYARRAPVATTYEELCDTARDFVEDYDNLTGQDQRWFYLEADVVKPGPGVILDPSQEGAFEIVPKSLLTVNGFITGENKNSILLQPIKGYQEFLKRARELLPKIINTTSLVDPFHTVEKR